MASNELTVFRVFVFKTGFRHTALAFLEYIAVYYIDQTDLKLTSSPVSASRMLELKVCAITTG